MKKTLLLAVLLLSIFFTTKAQVSQAEFDALVALYNATDGDNWTDNSNWNVTTGTKDDVNAEWKGITISGGHINNLSLGNNNLTGTLPDELGDLTYLRTLYLDRNSITGSIPTSIGNLTELTNLSLNNNQLTGSIPTEIGNLTKLRNFYVDYNSLSGTIPTEIGNLTEMTYIRLRSNNLTGEIPSGIGNLVNLMYLYLDQNQFSGNIPSGISNLTKLQVLTLYGNNLEGSILTYLENLTELRQLHIYNNNFSGTIPENIGNLTNLKDFKISNNNFTGEIPTSIGNLAALEYLFLFNNNFTGSIPSTIGNLTTTKGIRLDGNQLTGSIPVEIGNLTNMTFFYAYDNMLSGSIPAEIGNLINLDYLKLGSNQLSGEVPNEILSITGLQHLNIDDNQITGLPDLTSLPLSILYIQNNNLTFADIETNISIADIYSPQAKVGDEQNLYVAIGEDKNISVTVDGNNNTYQWYKDDLAISGATSDNYTITDFQLSNEGTYYCKIKNTVATSLTLYSNDIVLSSSTSPSIRTHPETLNNACVDGTAIFSVEGNYGDTYQWQEKSPAADWQNISHETTWVGRNTKTITSVQDNIKHLNRYSYRCIVTNPNGSVTSNAAVLNTDSEAPKVEVQSYTLELDETGAGTIKPSDFVVSASDNCSLADTTLNQTDFDCSDVGASHGIYVRVYDNAGKFTTKQTSVLVVDNIAPELSVQDFTLELDADGNGALKTSDVVTNADDNCSVADTVLSKTNFNCSNIGTPVVIDVTIEDTYGNETTKQSTITVVDNVDPVLSVQNHTIQVDEEGNATLNLSDVVSAASDNCELADTTLSKTNFDCSNVGTPVSVNVTLTDANGNSTIEQVTITVEDNIDPEIISTHSDKAISDEGNCQATMPDYTASIVATDNCDDNLTVTQFPLSGTTISGQIPVTLTVTDDSGNEDEVGFNLYVDDTTNPNLVAKDITLQLDANGEASLKTTDVVTRATDNCTIADTTLSKSEFDCSNISTPVTVDVTLTDEAGNSDIKQITVTVEDNIKPMLSAQNFTIELNASGNAILYPSNVVTNASDNCSLEDTTLSQTSFSCANIGTPVTVDVTLTDISDNSTKEQVTITVVDNIKPVLSVQDHTLQLNAEGNATLNLSDVVIGASDNCEIADTTLSQTSFSCTNTGTPVTVDVTLTDISGNSTKEQVTITVVDKTNPEIPTLEDITEECSATVTAPTTTDGCAGTITATTNDPLTYNTQGEYTITWNFDDGNGNEIDVDQKVIIKDITLPTIECRADTTINLTNESAYTVPDTRFDPLSTDDNCSIASISNDFNNTSSLKDAEIPTGTTTIIWTITDEAGNKNTCSYSVTVNVSSGTDDIISSDEIKVYPNPASNYLHIDNPNQNIKSVSIYDLTGRLVNIYNLKTKKEKLNISNLENGVYLVNISGENYSKTIKLIKE